MDTKQHVLVLDEQGDASRARCLEHGLLTAGIREDQIASAPTQERALEIAAKVASSDDLLVVLGTDVRKSIGDLRSAFDLAAVAIPAKGSSINLSPGTEC